MSNLTGIGVMIQHALKGDNILYIKEDPLSVYIDILLNDISAWLHLSLTLEIMFLRGSLHHEP